MLCNIRPFALGCSSCEYLFVYFIWLRKKRVLPKTSVSLWTCFYESNLNIN